MSTKFKAFTAFTTHWKSLKVEEDKDDFELNRDLRLPYHNRTWKKQ